MRAVNLASLTAKLICPVLPSKVRGLQVVLIGIDIIDYECTTFDTKYSTVFYEYLRVYGTLLVLYIEECHITRRPTKRLCHSSSSEII